MEHEPQFPGTASGVAPAASGGRSCLERRSTHVSFCSRPGSAANASQVDFAGSGDFLLNHDYGYDRKTKGCLLRADAISSYSLAFYRLI